MAKYSIYFSSVNPCYISISVSLGGVCDNTALHYKTFRCKLVYAKIHLWFFWEWKCCSIVVLWFTNLIFTIILEKMATIIFVTWYRVCKQTKIAKCFCLKTKLSGGKSSHELRYHCTFKEHRKVEWGSRGPSHLLKLCQHRFQIRNKLWRCFLRGREDRECWESGGRALPSAYRQMGTWISLLQEMEPQ